MRRALIAGAGIGGLATALALAKAGHEAVVFERAPELAEFGAGLQLTPNATRILAGLGVLDAVVARATAPDEIRIQRGRDDSELSTLPLHGAEDRWGAPYLVIHRADLQHVLADACRNAAGVELRFGFDVAGVSETDSGVAFGLKRGGLALRESGDIAIGADGLRSRVRERMGLGAAGEATFSGRVAFRALIPAAALPARFAEPRVCLRLGRLAHVVHYPLRGGSVINIVASIDASWRDHDDDAPWNAEADRPALLRALKDWSRESRDLVAQAEGWRAWPLYVREPLASYAIGRVALVGDAAHPMVPFLAQGAGQGIEDAGALARCLAAEPDSAAALRVYSRLRAPRAGRIQREALAQARIYHMSGPMALARDMTMRALGPDRLLQRYDWIYSA